MKNGKKIYLSVIVPFFNEESNLPQLHKELLEALSKIRGKSEIVYVNDASFDSSLENLKKTLQKKSAVSVKTVSLRRNFGQTAATSAGIDNSQGEILAFLDADLQNNPKDLVPALEKLKEGYDAVVGWREKRNDSYLRTLASKVANFPKSLSGQAAKFLHLFKASDNNYPKTEVLAKFLEGLHKEDLARHFYWMSIGENKLLKKEFLQKSSGQEKELRERLKEFKGAGSLRFQLIDFYSYLTDDLLVKTDRASMYNSLEVRVPYLDLEVIDYAFSNRNHLDLFRTKKVLRNLLKRRLPAKIVDRKKKGFGIPLSKWLTGDLSGFVWGYLQNEKLYDFFNREEILEMWNSHRVRKRNHAKTLWMLTVFSGWLNRWYS